MSDMGSSIRLLWITNCHSDWSETMMLQTRVGAGTLALICCAAGSIRCQVGIRTPTYRPHDVGLSAPLLSWPPVPGFEPAPWRVFTPSPIVTHFQARAAN